MGWRREEGWNMGQHQTWLIIVASQAESQPTHLPVLPVVPLDIGHVGHRRTTLMQAASPRDPRRRPAASPCEGAQA